MKKSLGIIFAFFFLMGCEKEAPPELQPPVKSPGIDIEISPPVGPGLDIEIVPRPEKPKRPRWSVVDPRKANCSDYLRSACRVRGGGSGGSGACFKIDNEYVYVLTCRHVVGRTKEFIVEFWLDGKITGKYRGEIYKILKVDSAVIVIPVKAFKENELPVAIPISTIGPNKDQSFMTVGCPGLSWQTLVEGHIIKMNQNSGQSFQFIPPPKGGRSGSAIFQDGKIVGVLWGATKTEGYGVNSKDLNVLTQPSNFYFTASWCQYCQEMSSVIESLKAEGVDIQTVDYDLNTAFAELYEINSLPAYVNAQGETTSGVKTAEELREFYR